MLKRELPWLSLAAVSSVFVWLAFPPYSGGLALLVGLVPLFVAVEKAETWKSAALRAWFFGFLANVLVCAWVPQAVREFGGLPWAPSVLALLLLSAIEQSSWAVVLALRHILHKKYKVRPVLWTPLAIMALDSVWPKYFPSTFGNVFYNTPWLAQAADLTGVWGLTALIAATNECVAALVLRNWRRVELRRHAVAAAALVVLITAYGAWRLSWVRDQMQKPVGQMRVALVQPSINAMAEVRFSKDKPATKARLLEHALTLTSRALEAKPDLVIWPETGFPDTYRNQFNPREVAFVGAALDQYVLKNRPALLTGSRDMASDGRWFNSIHYLRADESSTKVTAQVYHKNLLLPLAEEVPLAGLWPAYDSALRKMGAAFFAKGNGPIVIATEKASVGPMICLEGLYPRFVRRIAQAGAQVLVNVTNDAWFGNTAEPELHFYLTAFRAIETRRPLVRAATSGISAVVDIDGSVRARTELFREDVLVADVPVYPPHSSPFLAMGSVILIAAGLYAAARLVLRS